MSDPAWPVTLPAMPQQDGFQSQRQDNKLVSKVDVGDDKVRKRFTGSMKEFPAVFWLTQAQADAIDEFHDVTLGEGSLPFTWTDPRSQVAGRFRFTSPPAHVPNGGGLNWRTTCQFRRIS